MTEDQKAYRMPQRDYSDFAEGPADAEFLSGKLEDAIGIIDGLKARIAELERENEILRHERLDDIRPDGKTILDFMNVWLDQARDARAKLERACSRQNEEICQTLGKALGYPWFKDDQKNFPGATEADGVCVGEHVAETVAEEAAKRMARLESKLAEARAALLKADYFLAQGYSKDSVRDFLRKEASPHGKAALEAEDV